jgi:hypothetical protein
MASNDLGPKGPKDIKDPEHIHITANLQKGVPELRIELDHSITEKIAEAVLKQRGDKAVGEETGKKRKITISLTGLDVDLAHNQSFGMMQASTGCYSNVGGPSC